MSPGTTLITGAAGNLGGLLTRHLVPTGHDVRLMYHRTPIPEEVREASNVTTVQADLENPDTLGDAVQGVDVVVHFAGVLFAPSPERFLPDTNVGWFSNLLQASLEAGVRRMILISFPHVEGPTSVDEPATGRLDRQPISVHARTRLEEEKLLVERTRDTATTPVALRLGMVYGPGILMIEAASLAGSTTPSGCVEGPHLDSFDLDSGLPECRRGRDTRAWRGRYLPRRRRSAGHSSTLSG